MGALTDSFNFFVQELRAKEQIKQTFGKYIDPRILERVLLQPGVASVAGGRQRMTVLFADLVGFTSLSERLTASLMVTLLNRHFGLQALAIQEHQGVVDKFVGDSVMAFWGRHSPWRKTMRCSLAGRPGAIGCAGRVPPRTARTHRSAQGAARN